MIVKELTEKLNRCSPDAEVFFCRDGAYFTDAVVTEENHQVCIEPEGESDGQ